MASDIDSIKAITAEVIGAAIGVGVHPRTAMDIAHSFEARLAGGVVRAEGALGMSKRERNLRIREAFNGRNHQELCLTFHISRPTLYRVLNTNGHS